MNSHKNHMKFNWKLIKFVKENRIIWDWDRKTEKSEHEQAWEIISNKLGRTVDECKKRWKNLRGRFGRLTKQGESNPDWTYYNELIFLKDVIKRRGNIDIRSKEISEKAIEYHEEMVNLRKGSISEEYNNLNKTLDDELSETSNAKFFSDEPVVNNHDTSKEFIEIRVKHSDDQINDSENIGIKYGEIFFFDKTFYYCCLFCNERYKNSDEFKIHCLHRHLEEHNCNDIYESYVEKKNTINVKEHDQTLSEIQNIGNDNYNDVSAQNNTFFKNYKLNHCDNGSNSEKSSSDEDSETTKYGLYFQCALCSLTTKKLKIFKSHGEEIHPGEAIFKCFKCPRVFEKLEPLLDHKINCQKYSNSCCRLCDKKFKSKRDLIQHNTITHNKEFTYLPLEAVNFQNNKDVTYFKCGLCNFETLEKKYYIDHCSSEHPDEDAFKCDVCNISVPSFSLLENHRNVHKVEVLKCKFCNQEFLTPSNLKEHELTHSNFRKEDTISGRLHREILKCGCCNFETQIIKMFLNHCEEHIVKGESPFKCWVCGKIFKKYCGLVSHRKLHRRLNDSACSFCGKIFHTYKYLRDHERGHTGQRTIYRCQYCSKEFRYSDSLRDHENIHTGNRPYKCTFCERAFSFRTTWQTHVRVKHLNDKRFECKICGLKYLKRRAALEHEASHSGNKLYVCDICGNNYKNDSGLISHLKIHKNLRNYKCEICGKGFNTANYLTRHMWIHSDEKNWVCELCGNKFVCKKNLKQHMKIHYKNIQYNCEGCEMVFLTKATFESHNCES